jgi:hypothetical protein
MSDPLVIEYFISHNLEGSYFTIPFNMPSQALAFKLTYSYEGYQLKESHSENGTFTSKRKTNIIDLGIIAPNGDQVGASGSDKSEIEINEVSATPGYNPHSLIPGEWQILVGAYKIAAEGVTVRYEINFSLKHLQMFKGDLHTHTLASDGILSVEELAVHAKRHGLDYLAVTDHNQAVSTAELPHIPGLTLIPGLEWTHYRGHANFLGSSKPYDGSFMANSLEEIQAKFASAHSNGALININHPFDSECPFTFDISSLPFDCIEIWNGPMRESNLRAVGYWNSMLVAGKKIPISGGSDYHRDNLFQMIGGPTTCLFSLSNNPMDLLAALKQGHAYIVFGPEGPTLEMIAGEGTLGDSVKFPSVHEVNLHIKRLNSGDVIQIVTPRGVTQIIKAETSGSFQGILKMEMPGFIRVEVLRNFIPGFPLLPALISNPIYFDEES